MKKIFLEIRLGQYVCFAICLLLMAIIPITRSHKIIGINLEKENQEEEVSVLTVEPDGTEVINTTPLTRDIIGYGGPTPVEIRIKDGKISRIKVLPNHESPEYLGAVVNSDMLDVLYGKTLEEASSTPLDGVSGATFTSSAVKRNVSTGIAYALDHEAMPARTNGPPVGAKFIVTLVIILAGAILPLFIKNKGYRYLQLALNVAILGFWGGTFISYSLMVSLLTNGVTSVALIPLCVMLVTAFIYPMFGKVNHYCTWLCPYGALQELAGKCFGRKLRISQRWVKYLTVCREVIWFGLMWLLWTGLWFDWMGYEVFAAFFILEAGPVVLGIAGGFLLLSFFVARPYCRFLCPTGSLFKFSEGRR